MAKAKVEAAAETTSATEVVEAEKKELVTTKGVGVEILQSGLALIPQLSSEMTLDERKEAIRKVLKETVEIPDRLDVMAGELLYEVRENEYWKAWVIDDPATGEKRPYASFDEYAEMELGIKRRKAYYLCSIYEKFIVTLGLDKEVLRDLQWSKALQVKDVITPENWTEILEKIRTMSVEQIKEMVKEMTGKGKKEEGADSGAEEMKSLSFKLTAAQLETWQNAFELAKTMSGSDKPGNCLDLICMDFVSGAIGEGVDGALTKLETVVKNVERAYGVKLDIQEIDSKRYEKTEASETASA